MDPHHNRRREDTDIDMHKGPRDVVYEYTLLNTSRKIILEKYANTEIKNVGVKYPHYMKESSQTDKSKFYRLHKSHMHKTNECILLNHVNKDLIKEGRVSRYVK